MSEERKKLMKTILWGVLAISVIIFICFYKRATTQINDNTTNKYQQATTEIENMKLIIDDSEENPYIGGVQ